MSIYRLILCIFLLSLSPPPPPSLPYARRHGRLGTPASVVHAFPPLPGLPTCHALNMWFLLNPLPPKQHAGTLCGALFLPAAASHFVRQTPVPRTVTVLVGCTWRREAARQPLHTCRPWHVMSRHANESGTGQDWASSPEPAGAPHLQAFLPYQLPAPPRARIWLASWRGTGAFLAFSCIF